MAAIKNRGFSLLEVLIAFVILVVGLLGATTLIIRSSQINISAYETEQITLLANTLIEKIRINPNAIDTYINEKNNKQIIADCISKDRECTKEQRALTDMQRFQEQVDQLTLNNVDWTIEKSSADTLKGADNELYQLNLTWGPGTGTDPTNSYYVNFVLRVQAPSTATP